MRYILIMLFLAISTYGQTATNKTVFDSWYSGELFGAKAIAMHNFVRETIYQGKKAYEVNVYYKVKIARGDDKFETTTTENTLVYADLTPISSVSKSVEGAQKKIVTTTFSAGEVVRQTQIDDTLHKEALKTDKKIILDEAVYIYALVNGNELQKGMSYEYFSLNEETLKVETNTLKIIGKTAQGNWEVEITSTENSFAYTMYIDSNGEIVSIVIPGMNVNAVRTTREQAEIFSAQLILDIMFPCNIILPEEEHITEVELTINSRKLPLTNSAYQTVTKTNGGIRVRLHQHQPQVEENYICTAEDRKKFAKYLKAQPLIQCNSPLIMNKAKEIVSPEASTYAQVKQLQKWVFDNIKKASTSTANASSIATLNTMAGDCTEHANLFCALVRSLNIPSRVCGGLVYLDGEFGLHAWNEVYLGKWLVVDCALNRLGSNGKYIFFSYDYEKDDSDLVMNMMGSRPQIEIQNVWHGEKKIDIGAFVKNNNKWQTVEDKRFNVSYEVNKLWGKNDYSSDDEGIIQYTMNVNSAIIYSFFGCGDNSLEVLQPLIANHLANNFSSWTEREVQAYTIGSLPGKLGVYDATLDGKKLTIEIFFAVHNKTLFNIRVIYLTAEKEKHREPLIKSMNSMKLITDDNQTQSSGNKQPRNLPDVYFLHRKYHRYHRRKYLRKLQFQTTFARWNREMKMQRAKSKVLKSIEPNTSYEGCTFYLSPKWKNIRNNYFDNCSFRTELRLSDIHNCRFQNSSFSQGAAINLSKRQLLGIPKFIFEYTFVERLLLNNNFIKEIPDDIAQLLQIKELSLHNNHINKISPEISNLHNLQKLGLNTNHLHSLPTQIGKLESLEILLLQSNYLQDIPPEITNLTSLKILVLTDNSFVTIPPQLFKMKSLQKLYLNGNDIYKCKCLMNEILEELNIASNKLRTIPKNIEKLRSLRKLNLHSNNIKKISPNITNSNVEELDLRWNTIEKIPKEIRHFSSLRMLNLRFNALENLPEEIAELKLLQKIDVSENENLQIPPRFAELCSFSIVVGRGFQCREL